jgi:hypothetical protein
MRERRNAYKVLVKKPIVKMIGRYGLKVDDDINIDLKEIRWEGMD